MELTSQATGSGLDTPSSMMRICSLLPGATEVVAALGLADRLVGISHECDFPLEVRKAAVLVRATVESDHLTSPEIDHRVKETLKAGEPLYQLDEASLREARPDLVITQDLCQVCAVTPEGLQRAMASLPQPPQLLVLNPTSLDDVLADIERIGIATDRGPEARAYAQALRTHLQSIEACVKTVASRPRVLCLEWLGPFYIAGHWVPQMVALAGGVDPLGAPDAPSRTATWDDLVAAAPDILVLMPCGFSADRTVHEVARLALPSEHAWQDLPAVREGRVYAVDASSYFSRPGPRLVDGVAILASLCHPSLFGEPHVGDVRRVDLLNLRRR